MPNTTRQFPEAMPLEARSLHAGRIRHLLHPKPDLAKPWDQTGWELVNVSTLVQPPQALAPDPHRRTRHAAPTPPSRTERRVQESNRASGNDEATRPSRGWTGDRVAQEIGVQRDSANGREHFVRRITEPLTKYLNITEPLSPAPTP